MDMNPETVNKVIQLRRSVFQAQYTGDPVDDMIVGQMLQNAHMAPTHKITEPWRFVVFTGNGLRELANFQATLYKEVTTADGTFREDRFNNLRTKPLRSSHIIAIGMKRDERKSVPEIEEVGAVFCAIENMYLTATAYGIGGYLSTGGITYFEKAKEYFGLGREDKLIGFFHIGVPKQSLPRRSHTDVAEKVRWVR